MLAKFKRKNSTSTPPMPPVTNPSNTATPSPPLPLAITSSNTPSPQMALTTATPLSLVLNPSSSLQINPIEAARLAEKKYAMILKVNGAVGVLTKGGKVAAHWVPFIAILTTAVDTVLSSVKDAYFHQVKAWRLVLRQMDFLQSLVETLQHHQSISLGADVDLKCSRMAELFQRSIRTIHPLASQSFLRLYTSIAQMEMEIDTLTLDLENAMANFYNATAIQTLVLVQQIQEQMLEDRKKDKEDLWELMRKAEERGARDVIKYFKGRAEDDQETKRILQLCVKAYSEEEARGQGYQIPSSSSSSNSSHSDSARFMSVPNTPITKTPPSSTHSSASAPTVPASGTKPSLTIEIPTLDSATTVPFGVRPTIQSILPSPPLDANGNRISSSHLGFLKLGLNDLIYRTGPVAPGEPSWVVNRMLVNKEEKMVGGSEEGGTEVWRGMWRGRQVAIKQVGEEEFFKREVDIWSSLNHPNILPFFGATHPPKSKPRYILSPYCTFGTLISCLEARTKSNNKISWAERLKIAIAIADGLAYLNQEKKIVHADFKGDQGLIGDGGEVFVMDFNESFVFEKGAEKFEEGTGLKRGCLRWMAPELLVGSPKTFASDSYGLAITLWQLFTEEMPYENIDDDATIRTGVLRNIDPLRPPLAKSEITSGLAAILRSGWTADSSARPTASDIAKALRRLGTPATPVGNGKGKATDSGRISSDSMRSPSQPITPDDYSTSSSTALVNPLAPNRSPPLRRPLPQIPTQCSPPQSPRRPLPMSPIQSPPAIPGRASKNASTPSLISLGSAALGVDCSPHCETLNWAHDRHCPQFSVTYNETVTGPINNKGTTKDYAFPEPPFRNTDVYDVGIKLWAPTKVQIGDIGFLSSNGSFTVLSEAAEAPFRSFRPLSQDIITSQRSGKGTTGFRTTFKKEEPLKSGRGVARRQTFSSRDRSTGAFAGVIYDDLKMEAWSGVKWDFNTYDHNVQAKEKVNLAKALLSDAGKIIKYLDAVITLQERDLIFVTGIAKAESWAMFVAESMGKLETTFHVHSQREAGQPWGTWTLSRGEHLELVSLSDQNQGHHCFESPVLTAGVSTQPQIKTRISDTNDPLALVIYGIRHDPAKSLPPPLPLRGRLPADFGQERKVFTHILRHEARQPSRQQSTSVSPTIPLSPHLNVMHPGGFEYAP